MVSESVTVLYQISRHSSSLLMSHLQLDMHVLLETLRNVFSMNLSFSLHVDLILVVLAYCHVLIIIM